MISSILIPTDFSPASWKATQLGIEMAKMNDETVLSILHIYPMASRFSKGTITPEIPEKMEEMKEKMNHLAKDFIDDTAAKIRNVVLSGNVQDTMLKFVQDNRFDLVIIGINSNGFDNYLGSHTLSLIEKSGTPVMVIPNKVHADGALAG